MKDAAAWIRSNYIQEGVVLWLKRIHADQKTLILIVEYIVARVWVLRIVENRKRASTPALDKGLEHVTCPVQSRENDKMNIPLCGRI